VSAAGPNYDHTATPGTGRLLADGVEEGRRTVGPLRQKFNDCRLVSLRIEGSTANKVVKITPQWLSIDSGEIFTSDPVKTIDGDLPLLFTEGVGPLHIDGSVYRGESSFAIVISDGATAAYGDDVVPFDVGFGDRDGDARGDHDLARQPGAAALQPQIYGTTSPAVGAKPMKTLPGLGSWTADLRKGQSITITITGARRAARSRRR
jgi:hypothetical protein